jgi:hypothetical protein
MSDQEDGSGRGKGRRRCPPAGCGICQFKPAVAQRRNRCHRTNQNCRHRKGAGKVAACRHVGAGVAGLAVGGSRRHRHRRHARCGIRARYRRRNRQCACQENGNQQNHEAAREVGHLTRIIEQGRSSQTLRHATLHLFVRRVFKKLATVGG